MNSSEQNTSKVRAEPYPLSRVDVASVTLFWLLIAFISTAGRRLDPGVPGLSPDVTDAVVRSLYVEYAIWAVLTLPVLWLTTRYSIEGGRRIGRMVAFLAIGLPVALAVDGMLRAVRDVLLQPLGLAPQPASALVGLGMVDDLMMYIAVLGAGVARDYFLRFRAREAETAILQAQLANARLDALRAQLNPHFLFNTLNAISALVERDPRGTRRMIARLSDLLRHTLAESSDAEVPLARELELVDEYIDLMQIRFQGKLAVDVRADQDARAALVPNLLLQPIVENAIKHGLASTGAGTISISARRSGSMLEIIVADSGPGPAGGPEGVGLRNTNARLTELYGDGCAVRLRRGGSGGTEAVIVMPFRAGEPGHG